METPICQPYFRTSLMNRKDLLAYFHGEFRPPNIPTSLPLNDRLFLVLDHIGISPTPFRRLIEWNGRRYSLLLEYNKGVQDCAENKCLGALDKAMDQDFTKGMDLKSINKAKNKCMDLFWPFLEKAGQTRVDDAERECKDQTFGREVRSCVKIQLKTVNGSLAAMDHDKALDNRGEPVKNPAPHLPLYHKSRIERLQRCHSFGSKVKIGGAIACLKESRWLAEHELEGEMKRLEVAGKHPNILSILGALDAGNGKVKGFLSPFIEGVMLDKIKEASSKEKETWKEAFSDAIRFLHQHDIAWGDVKTGNIIIRNADRAPILIDFEPGASNDLIPQEIARSKEGDLHGLERIKWAIDNIPRSGSSAMTKGVDELDKVQ